MTKTMTPARHPGPVGPSGVPGGWGAWGQRGDSVGSHPSGFLAKNPNEFQKKSEQKNRHPNCLGPDGLSQLWPRMSAVIVQNHGGPSGPLLVEHGCQPLLGPKNPRRSWFADLRHGKQSPRLSLGLRILRLIPKFCSLVVRGRLRQGACRFLVAANARSIVRLA